MGAGFERAEVLAGQLQDCLTIAILDPLSLQGEKNMLTQNETVTDITQ